MDFRKEIISLRRYGEKTAIMFSALAFALFHMNVFQFFYAFGLGLMFGYVYTRTSRLRYSVAMHADQPERVSTRPIGDTTDRSPHLDGTVSEAEIMRMAEAGNMGDMGIMMLYGTVMLGLCIAGIVLLITKRKSWEFYLAPEGCLRGLKYAPPMPIPALSRTYC